MFDDLGDGDVLEPFVVFGTGCFRLPEDESHSLFGVFDSLKNNIDPLYILNSLCNFFIPHSYFHVPPASGYSVFSSVTTLAFMGTVLNLRRVVNKIDVAPNHKTGRPPHEYADLENDRLINNPWHHASGF